MYSYARRIKIVSPDGLNSKTAEPEELVVFPNPASDRLFLRTDRITPAMQLSVYNTSGQILESLQLTSDEYSLDVSGYARGVYFIRVSGEGFRAGARFTKE